MALFTRTLLDISKKLTCSAHQGPASVGLLYHEVVGKLVTEGQFVQAVGLSSVLPGSDALQLAMYIGYAVAGIPADLSRCLRPFCLLP
ncbi:MAG: chromate transporter [Anaerolineales bacterium]